MKKFSILTLAALVSCGAPAHAQSNCAPEDMVKKGLLEKYGESVRSIGLASANVMQLYVNEETGTWTVTLTNPQGISCLVSSGNAYGEYELTPLGEES